MSFQAIMMCSVLWGTKDVLNSVFHYNEKSIEREQNSVSPVELIVLRNAKNCWVDFFSVKIEISVSECFCSCLFVLFLDDALL